ncbi:hypothetical protein SLEP1_g3132 [Rubroshorea leprosula]|uniref:Uncharacterized protein n=1 Tax=Rubroshorea leprosula TaxID=152421 RepID=A0AAV5HJU2_9ROSI|nr:hypothetical protein SLEP1_g3132 [Rubroshorea leprosula]
MLRGNASENTAIVQGRNPEYLLLVKSRQIAVFCWAMSLLPLVIGFPVKASIKFVTQSFFLLAQPYGGERITFKCRGM